MKSRVPSQIRWTKHKNMDELLEDPLAEGLYGLFLKVKDSPRHVSIKPEKLINEVYYMANQFYQDPDPSLSIDLYAHEIESDLGWSYASDLVMVMTYALMKSQKNSKKIESLLLTLESRYKFSSYWIPCQSLSFNMKQKTEKRLLSDEISQFIGKTPIFIINKVDQFNAILGNNATIER